VGQISLVRTRFEEGTKADGGEEILGHLAHDPQLEEVVIRMGVPGSVSEIDDALPRTNVKPSSHHGEFHWETSAGSLRCDYSEHQTTPWWLWWNILSLDAPAVSIVWALLFAYARGTRLTFADEIVLSLTVWAIYTGDRLLDGWKAKDHEALQQRHLFSAKHRTPLACLVVLAVASGLWVTARYLAPAETSAGALLGVVVALYMAGIHAADRRMERFVSKEVVVGVLFAFGTTLPVWSQSAGLSWEGWASLALFALLCSLNCLSIECWENSRSEDVWQKTPPLVRWANARINYIAVALAASAVAIPSLLPSKTLSRPELFAVSLAALLILLLNRNRRRLSLEALRVLADAALVVPALAALLIRK
jgi:hypothetical protein